MTKTVYLTGDRSLDPITSVQLAAAVLQKTFFENDGDVDLITGDAPTGIERAVRYLIPESKLTVAKRDLDSDGRPDFDSYHTKLAPSVDNVIVVHNDPLDSKIGQSAIKIFGTDKVSLPLQEI